MRPVTEIENKQPYIERAQKDYFSDKEKYNSSNIITGESLYHELKEHLLGEPEQREIIRKYEEKLSQYFFDNETITLIPKHDQDVVNIKIGSDKQFPISELGDGLQQVIILTYEAFIKKDETHAFFIEEPELHMHAGMVRQLMNFYLNETKHYYFFTTHSNHLLDMADESDQVIIQKFVKQPKKNPKDGFDFKIYRCDRDRDLLASLGVKPSSVYLANCTIWVEGITDRLYITKYMEKYLVELKNSDEELYKKWAKDGHLRILPGSVIDYRAIVADILKRNEYLGILAIGYDPYRSIEFINMLSAAGAAKVITPVKQTYATFTSPIESFEITMAMEKITFDPNPITAYCFGNALMDEDKNENRKPIKRSQNEKIDGVITNLMDFWLFNNVERS